MANTGTIHVKIEGDTTALVAALLKHERGRLVVGPERMRRFNAETNRIAAIYRISERWGKPVWDVAPVVPHWDSWRAWRRRFVLGLPL